MHLSDGVASDSCAVLKSANEGDAEVKNTKMQCVELNDDNVNPIHCPFCGTLVGRGAEEETVDGWIVGQCKHLLFAAHDEGFEYRSERFDEAVDAALGKKTDEEREEIADDINQLVEVIKIQDAFMFHSMMGPPAQFSTYIAFAPLE
jgi:hypothetical protein